MFESVRAEFFSRLGGASPKPYASLNTSFSVGDIPARVDENRTRVALKMGVRKGLLFTPHQVHGDIIVRVTQGMTPAQVSDMQADALWTTEPGHAVAVQTADCAPVLLALRDGSAVAAIHAGWRGAANQIAVKTLREMCAELGRAPEDFEAQIGPCIGMCHFEVGPEVREALLAHARSASDVAHLWRDGDDGKYFVDLGGWLKWQLQQAGMQVVEQVKQCTVAHNDKYFSYRAEAGKCGRQISVIVKG